MSIGAVPSPRSGVDPRQPGAGVVVTAEGAEQGDEVADRRERVDAPGPLQAGDRHARLADRPHDATNRALHGRLEADHPGPMEDRDDLVEGGHRRLALSQQELGLGDRLAQHPPGR